MNNVDTRVDKYGKTRNNKLGLLESNTFNNYTNIYRLSATKLLLLKLS